VYIRELKENWRRYSYFHNSRFLISVSACDVELQMVIRIRIKLVRKIFVLVVTILIHHEHIDIFVSLMFRYFVCELVRDAVAPKI
jgi:hypothetical protein